MGLIYIDFIIRIIKYYKKLLWEGSKKFELRGRKNSELVRDYRIYIL